MSHAGSIARLVREIETDPLPIARREIVNVQPGRFDGAAVVLDCDDERARAIVQFLRIAIDTKQKQYHVRAYTRGPKGGWTAIR